MYGVDAGFAKSHIGYRYSIRRRQGGRFLPGFGRAVGG